MNLHVRLIISDLNARSRQIADITLVRPNITIGRAQDNDVILPSTSVSRRHAEIRWDTDGITVHDLGSDNGLLVNGQRQQRSSIKADDLLTIGKFLVRVSHLYCSSDEESTVKDSAGIEPLNEGAILGPPTLNLLSGGPTVVFRWIHLSDLHFGAGATSHRLDQRLVLRAIQADIEQMRARIKWTSPVDRLLVTGDIAYSAQPDQYREARVGLEKLLHVAGLEARDLRLTPGNHDVDREVAKRPLLRGLHETLRRQPQDLDDCLADEEARQHLARKLDKYWHFVQSICPSHPGIDLGQLDWAETIVPALFPAVNIRVVGLSTVWVSDSTDTGPPLGPGNMLLSPIQREQTFSESKRELVVLMSHHPPEWLANSCRQHLINALASHPHVHLCGHTHEAVATSQRRIGLPGRSIRYVAGAAHNEPDATDGHSYSWGAVRFDPTEQRWQVGWAPRVFVQETQEMRPNGTVYRLDSDGFVWETIEVPWMVPHA